MANSKRTSKLQHIHTIFYKHKFIGIGIVMAVLAVTVITSMAATSGPLSGATFTNDTAVGTLNWTSPGNAAASDDVYATVFTNAAATSRYLKATNFGFAIPAGSTIDGITVGVEKSIGSPCNSIIDNAVRIVKGGTIGATDKSSGAAWTGTDAYTTYGGPTDKWGETWTSADINNANFGFAISAIRSCSGNPKTALIDHIRITVNYTPVAAPVVTNVTSSSANGSYKAGQVIPVTVTFDQSVTVTGNPQLTLETGGADAVVNYTSGSPGTTLTFNYTVASGHTSSDLDYVGTGSLALNGGTIKDTATGLLNATLTLPTPGAAGSLGANKNIIIDTTLPTLSETTPVTTPTADNTPNYTFNSSEAGTISYGGDCSSATTAAVSGPNTVTFNPLSDGVHSNCTVTVTDAALNASVALNVSSFTIDSTAPILAQVTPVPTPTTDNTPDYTFSSDEVGTISYGGDCSSTTTAAIAGSNTITMNTLADGLHNNCTITVTDALLNASLALNVNAFTIDTTAPTLAEVTPVPTPTNDDTPNYTFSSDEAGTISYGGDCSSVTTAASVGSNIITFNSLGDGQHNNCTITVTDAIGNTSLTLNVTAFTVDTTPPLGPTISEVTPVPNPTNDSTPDYTFTSDDAGTITYGGACSSVTTLASVGNNTVTFAAMADGLKNDCTIMVTDSLGTDSNTLAVTNFTIDTVAPSLGEVTPVPTPGNDNTPDYTFSSNEAGTITYGGACSSVTTLAAVGNNTVTFNTLADGVYFTCSVTVTDAAGNASGPWPLSAFTIDTTAPVLAEVTAVPSPTNVNTPSYTFSSTETGTITYGGDCSSVTTAAVAGNNTVTFAALGDGIHNNCTIDVADALGNTSLSLNVNAFSVDTVAPAAITDLASSAQTDTSITLTWTAPGNNINVGTAANYDLRYSTAPINAGNFLAATAAVGVPLPQVAGTGEAFTVTGLSASTLYYFAIVTTDSANNVSTISNLPNFSSSAAPVVPVVPVAGPTTTGAGNVGGIGGKSCSGALCGQNDRLKTIMGQTEPPRREALRPAALDCGRSLDTEVTFLDTINDANLLFINDLYRKCVLNGRNDQAFEPDGLVTRAEFVAAVLRKFNLSSSEYQNSYSDVLPDDWFSGYIARALQEKLVNAGINFYPHGFVNRVQALKIVLLAKNIGNLEGYDASFIDTSAQDWFYHYVAYSQVKNLLEIKEVRVGKVGMVGKFYSFNKDLRLSDSGPDVKTLKEVLKQMGLYTGEINANYDRELAQSVLNFQSSRRLKVSGNFDLPTRTQLMKEDLSPRTMRYFMPDKNLTRSEMAALLVLIDR